MNPIPLWIGMFSNVIQDQKLTWTDRTPVDYTCFAPGQLDTKKEGKACVYLRRDLVSGHDPVDESLGLWYLSDCWENLIAEYMCKVESNWFSSFYNILINYISAKR